MIGQLRRWWQRQVAGAANCTVDDWYALDRQPLRFVGARWSWCWYDLWTGTFVRPHIRGVTRGKWRYSATVRVVDVYLIRIPTVVLRLRWAETVEGMNEDPNA